jgi:hypothetical protein
MSVIVRPRVNRSHLSVTVRPRVNRSHLSVIVRPRVNRSNKWAAAAHTFFANTTIALNKQQMCVCVTRKKTDSYTGLSMKRTNESSSVPHTSSHSKLSAHGCLSFAVCIEQTAKCVCVCVGFFMKRTNKSSSVPHKTSHSKLSAHGCLSLLLTL